jgi:hypothetical protein
MSRPQSQYVPGVGEFDTSDLPEGGRPTEYYRKDDGFILSRKPDLGHGDHVGFRLSRILTNTDVKYLRDILVNGYHVSVNVYKDDYSKLQVFIETPEYTESIEGNVSMDELDQFVKDHTK